MGLFDIFGEIVPELKELGDEIQGLKDDFLSSVLEPSAELRDTINDIASDFSGQGSVADDTASNSNNTSIPISDGNETA